jgi:Fe-S cluster assembly protein SufD
VTTSYLQDFPAIAGHGGAGAAWVHELRQAGLDRFQRAGFPSSRDEDWRFNNLSAITGTEFRLAPADVSGVAAEAVARFRFAIPGAVTLVFVNGRFAPTLSDRAELPAGVTVRNLAGALAAHGDLVREHLGRQAQPQRDGFTALNTAFVKDGVFIHVARGVDAGEPIHALFVTDPRAQGAVTHPRNLVLLEPGARVALLESYVALTEAPYFTNVVTEAAVGAGAELEYTRLQLESEQAFHVGTTQIRQDRDSRVQSMVVSFGAAIGRHNLDLRLDGPGIDSHLLGMYMGRGRQEVDNHTSILHAQPNCSTREIYKGILDQRAHGIFNGKIYVTPEAQQTDAKQTNRALLLSNTARIDTKPQLEIFADDVKCTHGATVGSIDPLATLYLRSRGIGPDAARKILTYAFAAEVLEEMPYPSVRTALEALVMQRLELHEEA